MTNLILPFANKVALMADTDYVGFTFFIGCMAMMAASAFFFLSLNQFDKKWRTSVLVSGLITFIAAVHYMYMRDYWGEHQVSPTFFRYVDWILTVPLMCVEFYLILKLAGAKKSLLTKMIGLSVIMLVTGYLGETVFSEQASMWGFFSAVAYFAIVYEIWLGGAAKLAKEAGGDVLAAHKILCWFVLVGWIIYPLGYLVGTADGQWYSSFANLGLDMDVLYNIADAINKIGFGLVIYSLAVKKTA
ncbi:proteorhodopsin [Formosa sp. Hel1_33_131]|uniref:bacteriorhodopsin-like n=1 Tax=Formosa sp. Hel1_33_131 TaxID=1336794 RepID=UPI00084E13A1|nr:bacteriorhodopsin-like [Formosa sp. Hel1_33_131]AOR29500.1 proteorhodopsin [Formosa sp. Hel1_33_131]